ncbi:MAG: capsular biosynthesis protein [Porticoccaceae bacterium]|nr:capsular biosynthesis protein [Porticoccaceae bacterium]
MIDLHCHLLPGIDDGPATLEQAAELCEIAVQEGTTHAICTPHIHPGRWNNTRKIIEQHCINLQHELERRAIPLHLGFAGEVRLSEQIMAQVENNEIPFYGKVDGYNIMLLEFPHGHIIPGSDKLVQWLLNRKVRPLIAHPERNKQVMKDVDLLLPFIEAGCWLQVTAGSIVGDFGSQAMAVARELLERDKVLVVASDGHNDKARRPSLKNACEYITAEYGESCTQRLTREAPARLVASQLNITCS